MHVVGHQAHLRGRGNGRFDQLAEFRLERGNARQCIRRLQAGGQRGEKEQRQRCSEEWSAKQGKASPKLFYPNPRAKARRAAQGQPIDIARLRD